AQHLANPMATPSPMAAAAPQVAGSPQPCFPFGFCQLFDPLANLLQHLPLQLIPSLCDQARQCYVGLAHEGVSFLLLSTGVWLSGDTLFSFTSEFQHEMLQPIEGEDPETIKPPAAGASRNRIGGGGGWHTRARGASGRVSGNDIRLSRA